MAKLSSEEVVHVAKLANLHVSKDEVEKFKRQLGEVISYIEELGQVDTSGVEATSQTTGLENVYREDKTSGCELKQEDALSGTDETHNGYFVVPALLKKSSM